MRQLAVLAVVVLAGCASGLRVVYHADPQGATLYQDGRAMGQTPMELTYQPEQAFKSGGCQQLRGTEVKWASGATAAISSLQVCAHQGWLQHYKFNRPDAPGRDIDLNYALQLERNAILRSQASSANMAAAAALLNANRQPAQQGGVGFLKHSYNSGFNTICVYDRLGSDYVVTIPMGICALSVR